jgi:hypothetical protein
VLRANMQVKEWPSLCTSLFYLIIHSEISALFQRRHAINRAKSPPASLFYTLHNLAGMNSEDHVSIQELKWRKP